jgi:hypothetical protein
MVNQQRTSFRLNLQVVQMLAMALMALAVPLALLILGIQKFSAKPAAPSPEAPGLRAALELAASKSLPPPAEIDAGCRRFVPLPGHGNPAEWQKRIEKSAAELGGTTIPSQQTEGGTRLLIQIPAPAAARFEAVALADFSSSGGQAQGGETRLYEILLPPP